jgi:hypothetical protein
MPLIQITIDNAALDELLARIPAETPRVADASAKRAYAYSQGRVPRRSGYLASTGAVESNHATGLAEGAVVYTAAYAETVEIGGARTPGRHFLESSAELEKPAFISACVGLLL